MKVHLQRRLCFAIANAADLELHGRLIMAKYGASGGMYGGLDDYARKKAAYAYRNARATHGAYHAGAGHGRR